MHICKPDPNIQLPEIFSIETVLGCNLKCPECALGGNLINRKKGFLSFDKFKIIADKIRPYVKYLYLHLWGEPMLNKDIIKIIKYASSFTKTNIHTNGNLFTEEMAEDLITSGVSDLSISIDGVTQEAYEKYRVQGDVNKAFKALEMLHFFNKKYGNKVYLSVQFVVFKHNQHEMDLFQRKCKDMGVPGSFKAPYLRPVSSLSESDYSEYTRKKSPDLLSLKTAMMNCDNPKHVFTILLDGSVVVCCYDHNGETSFGNIFEQEVLDIWNNEKYREFRLNILNGDASDFCLQNCLLYTLDSKNSSQTVAESNYNNVFLKPKESAISLRASAEDLNQQGYNLFIKGDLEGAFNSFSKAVEICSDFAEPYNNLGIWYWKVGGQNMKALEYFEKALKIDPNHRLTLLNYGELFKSLGRVEDTKNLYSSYLKRNPADKEISIILQSLTDKQLNNSSNSITPEAIKINLCSGSIHLDGYINIDISSSADISIDLEKELLPFPDESVDTVVCMSAINYFTKARAAEIIMDVYRVLKPGGITRFGTQDLLRICRYYVNDNKDFFYQKLSDGRDRFPGKTIANKINEWFYGYETHGKSCKYVYDFESLKVLFEEAGFSQIDEKNYLESSLENIDKIDNRPEQMFYLEAMKGDKKTVQSTQGIENKIEYLISYETKPHKIFSNEEHLKACMEWLLRAQSVGSDNGVSAMFYLTENKWHTSYPETTGYIIPTFLNYYHLTGNKLYLQKAIDMGDWEIEIQEDEGGIGEPRDAQPQKPRIFNTAQVILGFLSLYTDAKDEKYINAAIKAADWIVQNQHDDGKWQDITHGGPKSVHARTAWPLLALYNITWKESYKASAEKFLEWVLKQAHPNGWFENTSFTNEANKPWTHMIAYVLHGLLEIYYLNTAEVNSTKILALLKNAANAICRFYIDHSKKKKSYFGLPGTFDENWFSKDNYSCLTGNAQLAIYLNKLGKLEQEEQFIEVSNMLVDDLKRVHYLDEITDQNLKGALAGSHPFSGSYCSHLLPNWGVKFFADNLLQRLLQVDKQIYLG